LAAVVGFGDIWTSTDSGATWTDQTAAGSHNWQSITASSDGTKLAAVEFAGDIYTANAGITHINTTSANLQTGTTLASGLVGLWTFDGGDIHGTTAYDRSGQGNDGTLTGGPRQQSASSARR
jgi:hypothetical protein